METLRLVDCTLAKKSLFKTFEVRKLKHLELEDNSKDMASHKTLLTKIKNLCYNLKSLTCFKLTFDSDPYPSDRTDDKLSDPLQNTGFEKSEILSG